MNIHLKTLGCRLNEAELEIWAQAFQRQGHKITPKIQDAQLIVLNSCAVTQDAVRKSRQLIRRIHRDNPQAKLVISGCYATLNDKEVAASLGVDLVVNNKDKDHLVDKTLAELDIESMPDMSTEPGAVSLFIRGRQRAFIKVQDGCRYRCTFCIVTVARGLENSRPISLITKEINTLYEQGISEIVLTGVHLGGYGSDLNSSLPILVNQILEETSIPRLRLGSLEPWELTNDFYALFDNSRLMPHLHLPLQSGSDSVLQRMARRCKTKSFAEIVEQLRRRIPNFNITTDIMVGFPGETEIEWRDSLEFIEHIGFGHIHIFNYSPRAGTKAANFSNQIDETLKRQRSKMLHQLAEQMRLGFISTQMGKQFPVLWEGYREPVNANKHRVFGYTPNYLRVCCDIDNRHSLENRILPCTLTGISGNNIVGQIQDIDSY